MLCWYLSVHPVDEVEAVVLHGHSAFHWEPCSSVFFVPEFRAPFNLWGGADSEDLSGEYIHSKGIFGLVERPQP